MAPAQIAIVVSEKFRFDGLSVDNNKLTQMRDFLRFLIERDEALSFPKFERNVGISMKQWEIFRANNTDVEGIQWSVI